MRRTLVRSYLRRHPQTPKKVINGAFRELRRLKADKNLKHVCRIEISNEHSQVIPTRRGFRRNACSIVNIEPRDRQDKVGAATTIYHEALHARDISERGVKGISEKNEIAAHEETIEFLKDWKAKESREAVNKRIAEELVEERRSIDTLRA